MTFLFKLTVLLISLDTFVTQRNIIASMTAKIQIMLNNYSITNYSKNNIQGRPIKCYHFLNSYNFQNKQIFFCFIFRIIKNKALNFYLKGWKAIYCGVSKF